MVGAAPDFQKFISDARERRRNEALADKIFSRDRRQSAPPKLRQAPGGSLASRVGVNKQRVSSAVWKKNNAPSGNVDGEWTHDLHESVSHRRPASTALDSRISYPAAAGNKNNSSNNNNKRNNASSQRRSEKLSSAMDRMDVDQVNVVSSPSPRGMGMTIRGLAGPFAVLGQNFAPGTTAADIESAVTPIGGEMVSCRIVKTSPFVMAEMVFVSREGGERVIETFNDKTADGRLLKVYPKIGGYQPSTQSAATPPTGPAHNGAGANRNPPRDYGSDSGASFSRDLIRDRSSGAPSGPGRPLYSDKIVARNRRGRGFHRGG